MSGLCQSRHKRVPAGHSALWPAQPEIHAVQSGVERQGPRPITVEGQETKPVPGSNVDFISSVTSLSLLEFISLLRRQWRLIRNALVAAGVLALVYLLAATPQYAATASLIIDTRGQKILNVEEVLPALTSEIATIESQVEILRSRRIAERALQQASDPTSPPDETALRDFMRRVNVERKGLSYIIEVRAKDRDRARAAELANAIVDAYLQDQLAIRQRATHDAHEWLKARVISTSHELRAAEELVQQYRAKHGLVDIGEVQLSQREMADLTLQLIAARTKSAEAKARLLQVEQLAKSPDQLGAIGKVIESSVIVDLRRQETEIQRKLGNMISRFGEEHPSVAATRAELETLERDRAREVERLVKNAKNDFELTRMQETFLQENLESLKKQYAERNLINIGLAELEREADATRQLYTSLLKRLKETQAQQSLQTIDARVVAYAAIPLSPSSPHRALTLILALFAGLLVGVAAALVNDHYGWKHAWISQSAANWRVRLAELAKHLAASLTDVVKRNP